MKRFLSILFATLIPFHANAADEWLSSLNRDHPYVGQVFDLRTQKAIEPQSLLNTLKKHDTVLIGEKHDNPDHHRLEQIILNALIGAANKPAVILEMLDNSQSSATATLKTSDSDHQLRTKLNWNERGWPWEHYGPLVRQVLSGEAALLVGNISRDQVKAIYTEGTAALTQDPRLTSALKVSDSVHADLLDEVYQQHCETMPREHLAPMVNIQLARDAHMASTVDSVKHLQAILIAGGFHVRKDSAVPLHLKMMGSVKKPVVVMLTEVDPTLQNYDDYLTDRRKVADYIWFTPRFTDRDYCADLRAGEK